jgi:hypothetical protein
MNIKICTKCIYDEKILGIYFDKNGIYNYCLQIENLLKKSIILAYLQEKINLI